MFNETFAKQVFTLMVRKPAAVQQQSSFFWPSGESSSFIMAWGPQGQLFESWGHWHALRVNAIWVMKLRHSEPLRWMMELWPRRPIETFAPVLTAQLLGVEVREVNMTGWNGHT